MGVIAFALELGIPRQCASLFSDDPAVISEAANYLRIASISQLAICAEVVLEGALGTWLQRSFKGEVLSNSIFGTFFSTPGSANGTHEAVPKLPELPNDAFLPGSPLSMSRTLKPSR